MSTVMHAPASIPTSLEFIDSGWRGMTMNYLANFRITTLKAADLYSPNATAANIAATHAVIPAVEVNQIIHFSN